MKETCVLCRIAIDDAFCTSFNLDISTTNCTNKLLRTYLTEIVNNQIVFNDNNLMCVNCKNLLDDLDTAENYFKKVRSIIWNYVGYSEVFPTKRTYYQSDNSEPQHSVKREEIKCEEVYECTFCLKKFICRETLAEHNIARCVQNENISTQSEDSSSIEKHKKLRGVSKPYQCTLCSKTWKTSGELKSHISSHSDERPFICEVCGQSYKHKSALAIHIGMHNGVYPFTCKYCKKSFTQKGALKRHLPIHTGDTPYQCDICGKRFVHHTSFNIHKLSHSGQKDYKCAQCGLALLSASHLKRHMRVHTGEKKYACHLCDKRFAERYNLASHQKLHEKTGETAYKRNHRCSLCVQTFNRRLKLDEHMAQIHQK